MAIARTGPTNGCAHAPGCPHDIGPAAAGIDGLAAMGMQTAAPWACKSVRVRPD